MGCNCGSRGPAVRSTQPVAAEPGDYRVVYPNGTKRVFRGIGARREAAHAALTNGGRYERVEAEEAPQSS